MLERIGSSDAIRYMVQECGMTLSDASVKFDLRGIDENKPREDVKPRR